jgi:aspartyl-tRNA(Asn)/glutamyl-tRNA(Gln) amidotransferase subunit A
MTAVPAQPAAEPSLAIKDVPDDPLRGTSLLSFGAKFRSGEISSEAITRAYLARIAAVEPRISCFIHVATDAALASARAVDALAKAGVDLGPLMGVPVAFKDLFFVDNMPTRAGSNIDIGDLVGPEDGVVRGLRRGGAVILGKTKQSEFAFAANLRHDSPWNPWDAKTKRHAGTSSSGSAVAMACRFSGFTIGSDAGGSVRQPAALNGVVGYKSTVGVLPTAGALQLSATFDSIGTFHPSAADAAIVVAALRDEASIQARSLKGLRLGLDCRFALDGAHAEVAGAVSTALEILRCAGVEFVPMTTPGIDEIPLISGKLIPAEMVAFFGRDRLLANRERIDPVAWERLAPGIKLPAHEYLTLLQLHRRLVQQGLEAMQGLDGWIMPTVPEVPLPLCEFPTVKRMNWWNTRINDATRLVNYLGQCAVSLPLAPRSPGNLPIGLQIVCSPNADRSLLSIAMAIETVIGQSPAPDLNEFFSISRPTRNV